MTDTATNRASICPDCRSLIPANPDDRRSHREWHADTTAKHRGVQKRISELSETTSRTAAGLGDLRRDVENTEIPEPVEPMRVEEWPEDELDEDDYETVSTYADDIYAEPTGAPVSPAQPAIDRDDDLGPYNASTRLQ